jgi:hypothetical protein
LETRRADALARPSSLMGALFFVGCHAVTLLGGVNPKLIRCASQWILFRISTLLSSSFHRPNQQWAPPFSRDCGQRSWLHLSYLPGHRSCWQNLNVARTPAFFNLGSV